MVLLKMIINMIVIYKKKKEMIVKSFLVTGYLIYLIKVQK